MIACLQLVYLYVTQPCLHTNQSAPSILVISVTQACVLFKLHCNTAMFEQVVPCCFLSYQGLLLLLVFFLTLYVGSRFLFTDAFVPDLDKKAVFITGCDTGFGFELAKKLDRLGLRVFASCLTTEGQAKLTNLCSTHLTTLRMDVTVEDDVKNALEFVKCRLPPQGDVDMHRMFSWIGVASS